MPDLRVFLARYDNLISDVERQQLSQELLPLVLEGIENITETSQKAQANVFHILIRDNPNITGNLPALMRAVNQAGGNANEMLLARDRFGTNIFHYLAGGNANEMLLACDRFGTNIFHYLAVGNANCVGNLPGLIAAVNQAGGNANEMLLACDRFGANIFHYLARVNANCGGNFPELIAAVNQAGGNANEMLLACDRFGANIFHYLAQVNANCGGNFPELIAAVNQAGGNANEMLLATNGPGANIFHYLAAGNANCGGNLPGLIAAVNQAEGNANEMLLARDRFGTNIFHYLAVGNANCVGNLPGLIAAVNQAGGNANEMLLARDRHGYNVANMLQQRGNVQGFIAVNTLLEGFTSVNLSSDSQNTHRASVHSSANNSIQLLRRKYSTEIGFNQESFEHYFSQHHNFTGLKKSAVLRCVNRFRAQDIESYDNALLIYTALQDNTACARTSHENRERAFISALYECQRGGNLDESGRDLRPNDPDRTICRGGVVNKLIELLVGIHPDCEIQYATIEVAALKFPIIVKEECRLYFLSLVARPYNDRNLHFVRRLIKKNRRYDSEDLHSIHNIAEIKTQVRRRLLDEFSHLFQEEQLLTDFVNQSVWVDLDDTLDAVIQEITSLFSSARDPSHFMESPYSGGRLSRSSAMA